MGRPAEGWKLRRKGNLWCVRFTAGGRPVERSTGETDHSKASEAAAKIYAKEIRSPSRPREKRLASGSSGILTTAIKWLEAEEELRDPETNATYMLYARTHWEPFFRGINSLTEPAVIRYRAARLKHVAASTVNKELIALRAFVRWLELEITVPSVPKRAVGNRDPRHWAGTQEISPLEAEGILQHLTGLARERYIVAYETSLRPSTLDALEVPEHWQLGAGFLAIPREIDKARDGRPLPLTDRALQALEAAWALHGKVPGKLFPSRHRKALKAAAAKVLPPERARVFAPMDFRAGFATHALERTGNLPGVQYMMGHKRATTTARYAKPNLRAALAVLGKMKGGNE